MTVHKLRLGMALLACLLLSACSTYDPDTTTELPGNTNNSARESSTAPAMPRSDAEAGAVEIAEEQQPSVDLQSEDGSDWAPAPSVTRPRTGGYVGNQAPEFQGISNWINSEPLTMEALRGKVVLVDFWTYTCINCINVMPSLKDWHMKYADKGLVIVGVHSPEFDFEKPTANVVKATNIFGLEYPVAQDNDFTTWRSYSNRYWPAAYLIDQQGIIRYRHFGEGAYEETENQIRKLLEEIGADLS